MKPTKNQIKSAVAQLTIVSFFPSEPLKQALIMRFFQKLVGTVEQLEWLVSVLLTVDWPGPAQVRALFCTRFQPADGIKEGEPCRLSGFTPNDCEAQRPMAIATPDLKLLSGAAIQAIDPELVADMHRLEAKCKLQAARERGGRSKRDSYVPPDWLR